MRSVYLLCFFTFTFLSSQSQNVGIGTTTPAARLHVADSSVVFSTPASASASPGNPPVSGFGRRMMWYSDKAAFRAGFVENDKWDRNNVGEYSFAAGIENMASGDMSVALGHYNNALGRSSVALNSQTMANGVGSLATGNSSTAWGVTSTAMGFSTTAMGNSSVAMGNGTIANSFAEIALGINNTTYTPVSISEWNANDRLLVVGNGSGGQFSNALTILKNGRTGIGTSVPAARLHVADSSVVFSAEYPASSTQAGDPPVSGMGRRMMWYSDKAAFRVGYVENANWNKENTGLYSIAAGMDAAAVGFAAVSLGNTTYAIGEASVALNRQTFANGRWSLAAGSGSTADGLGSAALGSSTASGNFSMALGSLTTAGSFGEVALGTFNTTYTPASTTAWNANDRLLVLGNGNIDAQPAVPSNALVIYKNGNADFNNYFRISQTAAGPDASGLMLGYTVAGKQADAGKIQYGGFGGNTHWLNIVGGGTQAAGADRVIKFWSEGGMRVRGNTLPDADNTYSLGQSGARWSAVWSANGVIQTSDARLKTNISLLNYGLNELMQLQPVQYNWKTNPDDKKEIGFLAQDIQQIIPEAVEVPANGDALGMKYNQIIPVLVKAVQEQQQLITDQKKMLEEQQLQIDEMKKLLQAHIK